MEEVIPSHIVPGDHARAMRLALALANRSPCIPTNYRVGALLAHAVTGRVVSSGFTLELPGNTHAEECCLAKLAAQLGDGGKGSDGDDVDGRLGRAMTEPHTLYTTVEPCCLRLSGKRPCLERVLAQQAWIRTVVYGFREPDVFVQGNAGLEMLRQAGVEVVHVAGMENEIARVATAGHVGSGSRGCQKEEGKQKLDDVA